MKSARGLEVIIPNETIGTGGRDWIVGEAGMDVIWGFEGDDVLLGEGGNDVLIGGEGHDILEGGAGDDALYGDAGDDLMLGGDGMDSYDGGEGLDQVGFGDTGALNGVVADLRTQTVLDDGFGNIEYMTSVEGFGSGTRWADTFYGNEEGNLFWVGMGDDAFGFGGDDSFRVDSVQGGATIDGGAGLDTITQFTLSRVTGSGGYETASHGVKVSLEDQFIVDDGFGGFAAISGVENLGGSHLGDLLIGDAGANVLNGWDGADDLRGGGGDDVLVGGGSYDYLYGGAGDDVLNGGDGWDVMTGGEGVDYFDGGDGFDRVDFGAAGLGPNAIVADLRTQTVLDDGYGNVESMSSIEGFGQGSRFADTFYGNDVANEFRVGMGDDAFGFGGDDLFHVESVQGGATIDGGAGQDTIAQFFLSRANGSGVSEVASHGVTVSLEDEWIYDDGFGGFAAISSIEHLGGSRLDDVLIGDSGANQITGFRGNDILRGGGGDDTLNGGQGDDTLTGGEGADQLVFNLGPNGHDRVTDFQHDVDHLSFRGVAGIDDFSDLTVGHDASGNVVVSWGADSSVTLVGMTDVTASDFLFG